MKVIYLCNQCTLVQQERQERISECYNISSRDPHQSPLISNFARFRTKTTPQRIICPITITLLYKRWKLFEKKTSGSLSAVIPNSKIPKDVFVCALVGSLCNF